MKKNFSIFLIQIITTIINCYEGYLNYTDESSWGNTICITGKSQSPININSDLNLLIDDRNEIAKIESFDYYPINNQKIQFVHGYKYMIDTSKNGFFNMKIKDKFYTFNLHDIHFHLNSEHKINSKSYDIEVHLVHINSDNNHFSNNKYLVIAFLYKIDYGVVNNNSFIEQLPFNNIEQEINNLEFKSLFTKLDKQTLYFYKGGLTTPYCDESVNWLIIGEIQKISYSKFLDIKNLIGKNYPLGNNREIKPLNNRKIYIISSKYTPRISSFKLILIIIIICMIVLFVIYKMCPESLKFFESFI